MVKLSLRMNLDLIYKNQNNLIIYIHCYRKSMSVSSDSTRLSLSVKERLTVSVQRAEH